MKAFGTLFFFMMLCFSMKSIGQTAIPQSSNARSFRETGYKEYYFKSLQLYNMIDSITVSEIQSTLHHKPNTPEKLVIPNNDSQPWQPTQPTKIETSADSVTVIKDYPKITSVEHPYYDGSRKNPSTRTIGNTTKQTNAPTNGNN